MKSLKIFLFVSGALLLGALALGVYVWYTIQSLNTDSVVPAAREEVFEESKETMTDLAPRENLESTPTQTESTPSIQSNDEPVTRIEIDTLTESQQDLLKAFGIEGSITLTQEAIQCAKDAVGEGRLGEITKGSAPTPRESLLLFGCFK